MFIYFSDICIKYLFESLELKIIIRLNTKYCHENIFMVIPASNVLTISSGTFES